MRRSASHRARTGRQLDGGVFDIAGRGLNSSSDIVTVDSCMNCYLELGTVVIAPGHTGAAVALRPRAAVPIDGFATLTESRISMLNAPASSSPFKAVGHSGVGLLLDASAAPIVSNEFHLGSILNFGVNLLANSSGTIASNSLTVTRASAAEVPSAKVLASGQPAYCRGDRQCQAQWHA